VARVHFEAENKNMTDKDNSERLYIRKFENGLTVKELKELIKDWPETDEHGEDCEVWIETGSNLSSPVTIVSPLNMRNENGIVSADIILK
jgi:DNA-binding transcriptional MerR regulator